MNPLSLQEVYALIGGRIQAGGTRLFITGVATDSRAVREGDLFFALRGEHADGHDFLPQAFEQGARAAVVARSLPCPKGKGLVIVSDPLQALGDLAAGYRRRFPVEVVGITGSVGKTTAKEMAACVLQERYSVLKNEGNLNTEIGLPLTLFELQKTHQVAVLEMAMRGPGQIARLAEIAAPRIGAITNIGTSHLELLGSQEAIARAKGELLERLPPNGIAILNLDDAFFEFLKGLFAGRLLSFGLSPRAAVSAEDIRSISFGQGQPGLHFRLKTPAGCSEAFVPALGRYNISNALLGAAAGMALEISPEEVAEGLARFRPAPMRMEPLRLKAGGLLLNDTYNASPASMQAALETLSGLEGTPRIALLGDMMELGAESLPAHREVGKMVANINPDCLITLGERAREIASGAIESGMPPDRVIICSSHEEAAALLQQKITDQAVILAKGSRAMQMERIVEQLV